MRVLAKRIIVWTTTKSDNYSDKIGENNKILFSKKKRKEMGEMIGKIHGKKETCR